MKKGWPLLLLALLIQAPAARAQAPSDANAAAAAAAAERANAEVQRKTVVLVGEALDDAQALKLLENRVRAQAWAARLLWPRDPKAARAAFKAAADGVAQLNAAIDPEDPQLYNSAQVATQLRGELINSAVQFDANLALDFLRATRPPYAEALQAAGFASQEQSLEMSVVANIAAQDPKRAFEMAEENLSKGVTGTLISVVQQLTTKDPAAASKLAGDIARRLSAEDLRGQGDAAALAQQLIVLTRPAENPSPNMAAEPPGRIVVSVANESGPLLDEQTRRELFEKVIAAVAAGVPREGGGYSLFYAFQALLPELEKSSPARAAALRRKAEELERTFNAYAQRMRPFQKVMQEGTVEAMLEAARKAPAEVRDQLYTQAAWKAFNEGGDAEAARRILENVSPQQRGQVRREMEQRAQWRAIQEGGYAEALQVAARLKKPEDRVQALLQVAGRAASAGEEETARRILEETRGLVESQTRGQQQFAFRLQVANLYAQFDAETSFEIVESSVGRLDALLDAAEEVDGFGQDAFRDGELRPQQGGYIWSEMINQCAQVLAVLAHTDFERAVAAAKKFRRPEARTSAQLTLAQNLFGGYQPPNRKRALGSATTVVYGRNE